jgi:isopentenyl phosphate kinase
MKVLSYLDEVERIIFVTAVDGIIGKNSNGTRGENIRENSPSGLLRDIFISNDDEVADVTGSMYGKAERIAEMAAGKEVLLINGNVPGRLESAVKGEPVIGTLIRT